jgi:hypothetical protein
MGAPVIWVHTVKRVEPHGNGWSGGLGEAQGGGADRLLCPSLGLGGRQGMSRVWAWVWWLKEVGEEAQKAQCTDLCGMP